VSYQADEFSVIHGRMREIAVSEHSNLGYRSAEGDALDLCAEIHGLYRVSAESDASLRGRISVHLGHGTIA
jgi:hypothetical protein